VNDAIGFIVGTLGIQIQYHASIVWVKFVGTPTMYDQIDMETVNEH